MLTRLVISRAGLHASAKKVFQSTSHVSKTSSSSIKWTQLAAGHTAQQTIHLAPFSTTAADQSAAAGTKKFAPKGVEFYRTLELSEELKAVEADMPTYTDAVIAAAATETASFKKIGKAPPAETCRKIMYSSYRSGDHRQAHSSFLDLQVHTKLTLFEFNMSFIYQSLAGDFTKVHDVCFIKPPTTFDRGARGRPFFFHKRRILKGAGRNQRCACGALDRAHI